MIKKSMYIFRKEMKCIVRDRKSFVLSFLIPLLLVPILLFTLGSSVNVGDKKIIIAVNNTENSFCKYCLGKGDVEIKEVVDVNKALQTGEILAYVKINDNLDEKIISEGRLNGDYIEITNFSSVNSLSASGKILKYKSEFQLNISNEKIQSYDDIEKMLEENKKSSIEEQSENINLNSIYFRMLAPVMIIIYCCVTSLNTSTEISSNEKERGTWEPLLATGADRKSIIIGKVFASTLMSLMSSISTILGFLGYLIISSGTSSTMMSLFGILDLFIICFMFSLFISSITFFIGVYSRSSKEAQLYFMPISAVCVLPSFFAGAISTASVNLVHLSIPILNIIIINEAISGLENLFHLLVVSLWILFYVFCIFKVTVKLFEKESIIFRS